MADILISEARGLTDKTYLSIRVGDARRQMQFKPGCRFRFEGKGQPRHFEVDVFEKVATKQVSLADLAKGNSPDKAGSIELKRTDGNPAIKLSFKVAPTAEEPKAGQGLKKTSARQRAEHKAKNYLDDHGVQIVLQGMVHKLLESQPQDPYSYMTNFLSEHGAKVLPTAVKDGVKPEPAAEAPVASRELPTAAAAVPAVKPAVSSRPPTAPVEEEPMPGFPEDGSAPLPNLSRHRSTAAELLREDTLAYERLKAIKTPLGSMLTRCLKPGIDNRGEEGMPQEIGIVAGDEFCYDTFADVFEPIIARWHGHAPDARHSTDLDPAKITNTVIDPSGGHILSSRVRATRNISGIRMPSACSHAERREAERIISRALLGLEGSYMPLRGSRSWAPKPGGMSEEDEAELSAACALPGAPSTIADYSSGYGRHWPDARGVFTVKAGDSHVWVNHQDHVKVLARRADGDLKRAFQSASTTEFALAKALKDSGKCFAKSDRLGFLTTRPSELGTALEVGVSARLAKVGALEGFEDFAKSLGLSTHRGADEGCWDICAADRLGCSEVDQVNLVIEGCRELVDLEERIAGGEDIHFDFDSSESEGEQQQPQAAKHPSLLFEDPGLGNEHFPGFSPLSCPARMPDLSEHHSTMAEVLKADPSIYARLKDSRTPLGVSLAACIKTGIDNKGHPMVKTTGLFAGDAACYDIFREVFDPVLASRHSGFSPGKAHFTQMDAMNVNPDPIDPSGKRVISVHTRVHRSIAGLRMLPICSREERREAERILLSVLCNSTNCNIQGSYIPLPGSSSCPFYPGGACDADEARLRANGMFMEEPDAEVQLSAGFGRHWPEARGIFVGEAAKFNARVNDEDHLRFSTRQPGQDLRNCFARLCQMHSFFEAELQQQGYRFAHSQRLGFLCADPGNTGTGLTVIVTLCVPRLLEQPDFRTLCTRLGVQARLQPASRETGVVKISNSNRLGSSEVEQLNQVIDACRVLADRDAELCGEKAEASAPAESGTVEDDPELEAAAVKIQAVHRGKAARNKSAAPAPPAPGPTPPAVQDPHGATRADGVAFADIPGLGSTDCPGFPADGPCPDAMPDLSKHHSLMADVLKQDASIYESCRGLRTASGVTLARCIKTGVDNGGHPMIKTVGAAAGDPESYKTFRLFFDPLIAATHKDFASPHTTNLDYFKVVETPIDPTGGYVLDVRVRIQRNLAGLRLLPAISFDERRESERVLLRALEELRGELGGEYYPLVGSQSHNHHPQGMSEEEASRLREESLLFEAPDSALLLAMGSGRHWPDARGVFASESRRFAAWVNEEDHLRLMVSRDGGDLQAVWRQLCVSEAAVLDAVRQEGYDFAHSPELGFLTSCPSNLGSAMCAEVGVKLPRLSALPGFKGLCRRLKLQAHVGPGGSDEGMWDVSNLNRLGPSDVEQVNAVISGTRHLIELEVRAEKGEELDLNQVATVEPLPALG